MTFVLVYLLIGVALLIFCNHCDAKFDVKPANWKEDLVMVLLWPLVALFAATLVVFVIVHRREQ